MGAQMTLGRRMAREGTRRALAWRKKKACSSTTSSVNLSSSVMTPKPGTLIGSRLCSCVDAKTSRPK